MKNRLITIVLSLVLVLGAIGVLPASPVQAAGTSSIHIVKYDANGGVMDEETVNIATLESTKPVQGDGTVHYYTQGPTFDPNNLWDPTESCPADSLKDKGALKGTDIKDLCQLVGGMSSQDTVDIRGSDGYGDMYDYGNVYNPDPRQGKMVIAWWKDGQYSGSTPTDWQDGMLLAFFTTVPTATGPQAGKLIFGHQDMHDCMPSYNWHYYWQSSIQYPSTHGHYVKWISEIKIYTGGMLQWDLDLAGAGNETIRQSHFQNCVACHNPPGSTWTYNDGTHVWSGLPLWYVLGQVDDSNVHGPGSFNNGLYYEVKVMAQDYNYTFSSTQIARNNNIILANKMDGLPIPTSDSKYPLKLVSSEFIVGGPSVAAIQRIELNNISTSPPSYPPIVATTAEWPLKLYGAHPDTLTLDNFNTCLQGCHETTYIDGADEWKGIPLWRLMGYVDDANAHDFNDTLATANGGYDIWVIAADTYYQAFDSPVLSRNNNIILASKLNGFPLPPETGTPPDNHPAYPLKVVGSGVSSGSRVGAVVRIDLRNFPSPKPAWDLNNDHDCDILDVSVLGTLWGSHGTPGWIPEDINHDGDIDILDVSVLGTYWGQHW